MLRREQDVMAISSNYVDASNLDLSLRVMESEAKHSPPYLNAVPDTRSLMHGSCAVGLTWAVCSSACSSKG